MTYKTIKHERRAAALTKVIKVLIVIMVMAVAIAAALLLSGCTPPKKAVMEKPMAATLPPLVMGEDLLTSTVPHRAADTQKPEPTPARCTVVTGYASGTVNVRSGPGMSYPVVDVVQEGQELPLFGQVQDGWQRVCTPQLVEGWFYVERWCK